MIIHIQSRLPERPFDHNATTFFLPYTSESWSREKPRQVLFSKYKPVAEIVELLELNKAKKTPANGVGGGVIYFSSRRVITLDQADESEDSCHDFTIIYSTPFLCWHNCDYSLSHLVIPSGANSLLPTFRWKPETDTFRICWHETMETRRELTTNV